MFPRNLFSFNVSAIILPQSFLFQGKCIKTHKEGWVPKNWCFLTVVLEKTLESPLDSKETKPVHPKGNQPWIVTGSTDAEAETLILWPLMGRADSLEKTLMLGKIEGRRRRGLQRMKWLDGITDSIDKSLTNSGRQWRTGKPGVLHVMGSQRAGHDLATEQQQRTGRLSKIFFLIFLKKSKNNKWLHKMKRKQAKRKQNATHIFYQLPKCHSWLKTEP